MADVFIKNPSGEIWKNSDGNILKAKKMNEMPVQQGLAFWGAADPNYLTIVDGLVSEAYDIRGTGQKMIQNNVAKRPAFTSNYLYFLNAVLNITSSIKSMFIVMKAPNTSNNFSGLGMSEGLYYLGHSYYWNAFVLTNGTTAQNYYLNATKKLGTFSTQNNAYNIISSLTELNIVSTNIRLGALNDIDSDAYIKEWGWYNRLLTETEVIYNINALNAKYFLF